MDLELLKEVKQKAQLWIDGNYDEDTKEQVRKLLSGDEKELVEAFYRGLEFGTGGMRGVMGAGTNRMNKYTVAMATQGLANYILECFPNQEKKIAVAYDCRNNSPFYAQIVAEVMSASGIKVFLFDALRPTPELSFAIRHLNCQSGIVITASHNPKEYNGYKVYWDDGAQIIAPHDKKIIEKVQAINSIDEVDMNANTDLIETIGEDIDTAYLTELKKLSINSDIIQKQKDLKIVYTPIHGTGVEMVPRALKLFGFEKVDGVEEQNVISGDFPTVLSPNPEEQAAMRMALEKAKEIDADIVMATDPDADRVGIGVKNKKGEFVLMNGNQTAALLTEYLLLAWKNANKLTGNEYVVKTVVTSELLKDIADYYQVTSYDTLTGFKWIASVIRAHEGKETYIGGGEESYGYLAGDFVRDKDAVSACCLLAEMAALAKNNQQSLFDMLLEMYLRYGLYVERLVSIVRKGKEGAEEIAKMMENFRNNPPKELNNKAIVAIKDLESSEHILIKEGKTLKLDMPKSNVLQFFLEDGSKISMRPSGTEPKIKFYVSLKAELKNVEDFDYEWEKANSEIDFLVKALGLD